MTLSFILNGRPVTADADADSSLLEILRKLNCHSVRSGCDTANCGICTVWVNETPILSCSYPALRAEGCRVTTIEGMKQEAADLVEELAREGADQCGFCSPGFLMSALALLRDYPDADEAGVRAYLAGNLCRCSGYVAQTNSLLKVLERRKTNG